MVVPNLSNNALPWALIENMVVDAAFRRGGAGRQLTDYAVKRAEEARCYKIQLASTNSRKEAHAFHRSMEFKASAKGFRLYL
ncbi:MAG: GNAT family N-acetyltransferase [Dehalococcoidales bacterium]|jgi:GNAT superfamily N-acetyltransferase|nr:GNAT family N-acetyltransferase [Dehalococcoidales bacterium]MDP7525416.1 GNAT family N-acetyltransferase [Dehalococcoidales bacterium]